MRRGSLLEKIWARAVFVGMRRCLMRVRLGWSRVVVVGVAGSYFD